MSNAKSMLCEYCECGCLILSYDCLYRANKKLKDIKIEDRPQLINMVNNFILIGANKDMGLLGFDCFNSLCTNIKDAEQSAADYREANPSTDDPEGSYQHYMSEDWLKLVNNKQFQLTYASYLLYYYYYTSEASSSSSPDGDVSKNRAGSTNNGVGSSNIEFQESKRQTLIHQNIAENYLSVFKRTFWDDNKSKYGCAVDEDDCATCTDENGVHNPLPIRKKRPRFTAR